MDFYRRSVEYVQKHRRPGQQVEYTFQTNGVLIDDEWAAFFKQHDVLIGLSVDGPKQLHDTYRVTKGGQGTFDQVMRGLDHLRRHEVRFNILCTVNAANGDHGRDVYRFFRDELHAEWMQFIPIVERATPETLPIANLGWSERPGGQRLLYTQSGSLVTDRTVRPEQYGRFLIDIFEEWVRKDVGRVYVQLFDVTLEAYFGSYKLCIHAPTCGYGPAIEHNGDVYSCDHYVEPGYRLGNIAETHMLDLVASPDSAQVRPRQAGDAHEAVPRLRRALPLQRRLPEGSLCQLSRRRTRSQLSVRRAQSVLRSRQSGDADDGSLDHEQPRAGGNHGDVRGEVRRSGR